MSCALFNRGEFKPSLVVQDGFFQDGMTRTPRMVSIPDPMTKTCQFTHTELGKVDPKCTDCTHKACA